MNWHPIAYVVQKEDTLQIHKHKSITNNNEKTQTYLYMNIAISFIVILPYATLYILCQGQS